MILKRVRLRSGQAMWNAKIPLVKLVVGPGLRRDDGVEGVLLNGGFTGVDLKVF